jgi:hypothetical protein
MELEVIVFIVIGVIIAYLAYRMFFGKSKQESETVTHDAINAPYKVEPPSVDVLQSVAPAVVVSEAKAPELKVETGGKQSTKPRSRRPRNPRPKAAKTDTTVAAKPAAKAAAKPRSKVDAKPTPK